MSDADRWARRTTLYERAGRAKRNSCPVRSDNRQLANRQNSLSEDERLTIVEHLVAGSATRRLSEGARFAYTGTILGTTDPPIAADRGKRAKPPQGGRHGEVPHGRGSETVFQHAVRSRQHHPGGTRTVPVAPGPFEKHEGSGRGIGHGAVRTRKEGASSRRRQDASCYAVCAKKTSCGTPCLADIREAVEAAPELVRVGAAEHVRGLRPEARPFGGVPGRPENTHRDSRRRPRRVLEGHRSPGDGVRIHHQAARGLRPPHHPAAHRASWPS